MLMDEIGRKAGIYVVTLKCEEKMPIYGKKSTKQDLCVNRNNIKFGKTKTFDAGQKRYVRDFGSGLEHFQPIAVVPLDRLKEAEDLAKETLTEFRIREYTAPDGNTYTHSIFEWCQSISAEEATQRIWDTLSAHNFPHEVVRT